MRKEVDTSHFTKEKNIMYRTVPGRQKREERSTWVVGRSME